MCTIYDQTNVYVKDLCKQKFIELSLKSRLWWNSSAWTVQPFFLYANYDWLCVYLDVNLFNFYSTFVGLLLFGCCHSAMHSPARQTYRIKKRRKKTHTHEMEVKSNQTNKKKFKRLYTWLVRTCVRWRPIAQKYINFGRCNRYLKGWLWAEEMLHNHHPRFSFD